MDWANRNVGQAQARSISYLGSKVRKELLISKNISNCHKTSFRLIDHTHPYARPLLNNYQSSTWDMKYETKSSEHLSFIRSEYFKQPPVCLWGL